MRNPDSIRYLSALVLRALVAVCVAAAAMVVMASPAQAQNDRFACDPGFDQVINGQLSEFDPATGSYVALGGQHNLYNSMAHRFANGYMYAVRKSSLLRVKNAGVVTKRGVTPDISGAYTGDFGDDGRLHVSRGESCALAPPPPGITDVDGPEPETPASTPEGRAAEQSYTESAEPVTEPTEPASESTYTFDDAGLGTGASCPANENVDRPPRQLVQAMAVVAPTSVYSSSFAIDDGQWEVLSGMWTTADGAFQQLNDCGFDYTALLDAPALESFAFRADFRAVDGLNHGGIVINQSSPATRSGAMLVDLTDGGATLRWGTYDDRGYYEYIGSVPAAVSGSVQLGATVHGTSVSIELNGQVVAKTQSSYSGGYVGLVASTAQIAFDQVELTALPAR